MIIDSILAEAEPYLSKRKIKVYKHTIIEEKSLKIEPFNI